MYETFDHTADVGLRITAPTLEALLEDAARGLTSLLSAQSDSILPTSERTIRVSGTDPEYLLFDWLTEVLFAFATDRFLVRDLAVVLSPEGLVAQLRGERADAARHQLEHEVKAITYHGLRVERLETGEWYAEVIVDI